MTPFLSSNKARDGGWIVWEWTDIYFSDNKWMAKNLDKLGKDKELARQIANNMWNAYTQNIEFIKKICNSCRK